MHDFIKTTEKSSMGKEKDSCIKCGRMEEAHLDRKPEIRIYFNKRLWLFESWDEARKHGFYLVD